ncbi:putative quinol monooxygenase [Microlunatus sp. Gsoil 973]|uniref:putative quinol monooxygenase n=1 Tax=Microlunatus sp. Gsoil 973 TaxID=2672569 RepID=UPI0012B445F5|nr:putative quinol monooxygenase [Microlunatus sp. Gsoil 973]QGN33520.1 antibiotic biosynthesis monooxygenase [Microlunatus sp. Gsoil 973]
MILIVVKFTVLPEHRDAWLPAVDPFTQAVRAEPGNLWFDWSVSVDDPNQFVLVEGFADADAGADHVATDHFTAAMELMPSMLARTPEIINVEIPDRTGWSEMGELSVPDRS